MRKTTAALALATLAALGPTGCDDSSGTASQATGAAANPAAPSAAPFPAPGHQAVDCGSDSGGRAIVVSTTKGAGFCTTAAAVVKAYSALRDGQPTGDIAVTLDTVRWVCGERRGDPDPYQECASQNESADKIRLLS